MLDTILSEKVLKRLVAEMRAFITDYSFGDLCHSRVIRNQQNLYP